MRKFWKFLQGKKTSVGVILGAILVFMQSNNSIDAETAQLLATILVGLGLSANIGNAIVKQNENNRKFNR